MLAIKQMRADHISKTILGKQYQEVISARNVVFDYIDKAIKSRWKEELSLFNNKSICEMLTHVANTYKYWITDFLLREQVVYWEGLQFTELDDIYKIYEEVNHDVQHFLDVFETDYKTPLTRNTAPDVKITASPLKVFTHLITHEFHHKGQIMIMSRLLNGVPPDTDIIRYP